GTPRRIWHRTTSRADASEHLSMTRLALGFLLTSFASALAGTTITVAPDRSAQFKTVQAAVDSVPANNKERIVIHIAPGTYKERIIVPKDKPLITFQGDDAKTTILTYDWSANTEHE